MNWYTSAMFLRGIWKNDNNNLSFTWVCRSGKQSFILRNTSDVSCVHIEPLIHVSLVVPNLLCNHNDMSLSLTLAII